MIILDIVVVYQALVLGKDTEKELTQSTLCSGELMVLRRM